MTNVSLLDAEEFPCGSTGSDIVTAMSQVAAVAQVQSLAWKCPHSAGMTRGKKKQIDAKRQHKESTLSKIFNPMFLIFHSIFQVLFLTDNDNT